MSDNIWLYRFNPSEHHKKRLLVFSHAGASVMVFRPWLKYLKDVELLGVQLPGRGMRFSDSPVESIDKIVEEAFKELQELPDLPLLVFGHSFGALLAFEFVKLVERCGYPWTENLIMSAYQAPDRKREKSIHNLSDKEFIQEVELYGGIPEEILMEKELIELFLPALKSDFKILEEYIVNEQEKTKSGILGLFGSQDMVVSGELMANWSKFTHGEFSLEEVNGDHFFVSGNSEETIQIINKYTVIAQT